MEMGIEITQVVAHLVFAMVGELHSRPLRTGTPLADANRGDGVAREQLGSGEPLQKDR
jgi:hypothetical protein